MNVLIECIVLAPTRERFYNASSRKELLKKTTKVDAIIPFLKPVGLYGKILRTNQYNINNTKIYKNKSVPENYFTL